VNSVHHADARESLAYYAQHISCVIRMKAGVVCTYTDIEIRAPFARVVSSRPVGLCFLCSRETCSDTGWETRGFSS
jgi:hypothetical protein